MRTQLKLALWAVMEYNKLTILSPLLALLILVILLLLTCSSRIVCQCPLMSTPSSWCYSESIQQCLLCDFHKIVVVYLFDWCLPGWRLEYLVPTELLISIGFR